jgi:polyhydroxybutyrate depolymerase
MSFHDRARFCALIAVGCLVACSNASSATGAVASAGQAAPAAGSAGLANPPPGAAAGSGAAGSSAAPPLGVAGSAARAGSGGATPLAGSGAAGGFAAGSGGLGTAGTGTAGAAGTGAAAGAPAPVMCPSTPIAPGETNRSVTIMGMKRTFILHIPASYTGKTPTPLVVDFHPLGQTNQFQKGNSGYQAVSEKEGFIVAWPQGIQNVWNVGACCTQSRDIDDVAFAKALVADVASVACVDPKRVYADGYSMGGGMSHYLGCHGADVFATVVPSAFDLMEENSPDCKPSRPISVMSFRSTGDPIVPYAGGASNPPTAGYTLPPVHFLGAVATFKRWAELNQCTGTPVDTGMAGCQTYTQCAAGVEVTLCTKQGGSHDTGDATLGWAMMKKHPMP